MTATTELRVSSPLTHESKLTDRDPRPHIAKVAAVIPVFNRRETTLQALRSLSRIDLDGVNLDIFVVDDGSADGTADAIRAAFPTVNIVKGDGTLHYAGGTNVGIKAAMARKPDYFLLLNDDSVFHEQFLQRLLRTSREHRRSAVGALLLLWDEPHRVFQVGQRWRTWRGGWVIPQELTAFSVPQAAFEVECVVGNCVLVPSDAIRECGVMDAEKFPHGWGDAQYFMRLRLAGWKLFVEPKAYVWCEPNTNPPPLHSRPAGEVIDILFHNRRHPGNLHRQFVARWESAPRKLLAPIAFGIYLVTLGGKMGKYLFRRAGGRAAF